MRFPMWLAARVGVCVGLHGGSMPARRANPLQNRYVPVAQELNARDEWLIAETRARTFATILREIQVACPDPIPPWAGAFMCHLLVESLREC